MLHWLATHWSSVLGDLGIIAGLFFSGIGFWREGRLHCAQALLEVTKLHRDLWLHYAKHPELFGLFNRSRDMTLAPLTGAEAQFANLLFLHIRATYHAEKNGVYAHPEGLNEDLREIFSHPAVLRAWSDVRHLHDGDFIAFIERRRA